VKTAIADFTGVEGLQVRLNLADLFIGVRGSVVLAVVLPRSAAVVPRLY